MKVQNTQTNFKAIHIKGKPNLYPHLTDESLATLINLQKAAGTHHVLPGKNHTDHFIRTVADSEAEKAMIERLKSVSPQSEIKSIADDAVDALLMPVRSLAKEYTP